MRGRPLAVLGLVGAALATALVLRRRGRGAEDEATPAPVAEVGLGDGRLLRFEAGPPPPLADAAAALAEHLASVAQDGGGAS